MSDRLKIGGGLGAIAFGVAAVVGGDDPAARNLIAGNTADGIALLGTGSRVQDNLIGTDKTGTGYVRSAIAFG